MSRTVGISIHAPRTGSDTDEIRYSFWLEISIHAPRTGSDWFGADGLLVGKDFNPRSPHGERQAKHEQPKPQPKFQSTLPARGATLRLTVENTRLERFQSTLPARGATKPSGSREPAERISIHAPRTGSDRGLRHKVAMLGISIHAPRTGSDRPGQRELRNQAHFNPRSPHGEYWDDINKAYSAYISIHAPRTGSDQTQRRGRQSGRHFNPRSPHGERRMRIRYNKSTVNISIHAPRTGSDMTQYLNTERVAISIHAPRTGSDNQRRAARGREHISIHAPRTGSDSRRSYGCGMVSDFNPRSPHGERQATAEKILAEMEFQSTLPARGATFGSPGKRILLFDFNPRSPHGERLRKVTILSIRIIGFAQKVYHKTVLLRISLAENAVILPEKPRNPVRTSLQKAGGLRFARAIRAARPYSISSPSGA